MLAPIPGAFVANPRADFSFSSHGSVCLLTPHSPAAHDWVGRRVQEGLPRFGGGIPIEPRHAGMILLGLSEDRLTVIPET